MSKEKYTYVERWSQVNDLLYRANGSGLSLSDIANSLGLSRKRTYDILERMFKSADIVKCRVQDSRFHFGMSLYFHVVYFKKITGIENVEAGRTYTLRQRSIFELIGNEQVRPDEDMFNEKLESFYRGEGI